MRLMMAVLSGVVGLICVAACSAANVQYAGDLQSCIHGARDAGDSGAERLAAYNACADALDMKDGGK